jgi:hypothetical protein
MHDFITNRWEAWQDQRGPRRPRPFRIDRPIAEADGVRETQPVISSQ